MKDILQKIDSVSERKTKQLLVMIIRGSIETLPIEVLEEVIVIEFYRYE